ncbi:DUF1499 domain-containing protein [Rubrobacter indicoceani]|uniref:DUF1499 domain-containing protein n=1 Tax=Rubrobacter indicoceani TaxID=2051957 RepID=UPI001968F798|nr:DUF1499 domain-containing protein [Rubrobacter indicoceani]
MSKQNRPEVTRTGRNSARAGKSYPRPPEEVERAVRNVADRLPGWELAGEPGGELHLVRRTKLMRFRDDVRVRIAAEGQGLKLVAESSSRVGRSDLGQNPRNLAELLPAIDRELGL